MTIIDPETEKVLLENQLPVTLEPNGSSSVNFKLSPSEVKMNDIKLKMNLISGEPDEDSSGRPSISYRISHNEDGTRRTKIITDPDTGEVITLYTI